MIATVEHRGKRRVLPHAHPTHDGEGGLAASFAGSPNAPPTRRVLGSSV
jgi:hypothetical protein